MRAVKAAKAENLRVRFSFAVGPWRKSMSVSGIMETVMRSIDNLRCVIENKGRINQRRMMHNFWSERRPTDLDEGDEEYDTPLCPPPPSPSSKKSAKRWSEEGKREWKRPPGQRR
ncbi:unnamed protein product [Urochloa humidicola]